ncbi:MAG: hypothetical protein DMF72_15385 [Acidobacteria bacterium]|nr:MAG: hypothetical protein DMF72_15385 [Acidobacteriota bacterium]
MNVIVYILAIIAYVLIITHYLPRSVAWQKVIRTFGALKVRWEGHRIPASSYSLRYEVPAVVAASLLLNLAGWGITSRNPHILYLDMAGTAATAFLIGPWWAATVGIITPFVVAAIYPSEASVILTPWMLVHLAGGIFWGLMARRNNFRRYVNGEHDGLFAQTKSNLSFLFWYGVVGACVTAIAGSVVSLALRDDPAIFARSPDFAEKLQSVFAHGHDWIQTIPQFRGSAPLLLVLNGLLRWGITTFRYIPDKTISAAVGLLTAKYVLPLYEHTLIRCASEPKPGGKYFRGDNWLTPAIALFCYVVLLPWNLRHSAAALWLWYIPVVLLTGACLFEIVYGGNSQSLIKERTGRVEFYLSAKNRMPRQEYFGAIVIAILIASLVFMIGLLLVNSITARGTVAFYFLGTVLTYLLAFYVMRVSMRQWVTLLSRGDIGVASCPVNQNDEPQPVSSEPV